MGTRLFITTAAAIALAGGMAASAQTTEQRGESPEKQVTLVGCIQREADYRRANDSGRGTLGTGLNLGNEYILVAASPAPGTGMDCTTVGAGDAYELTGTRERDLEQFVGRRVEVTGMQKSADTVAGSPTGGIDPLGQDLELFEVNVTSFREAPVARQAAASATSPAPAQSMPAPQTSAAAAPAAELPRTASPVPLAGVLGLLALVGAAGIRSLRRRS